MVTTTMHARTRHLRQPLPPYHSRSRLARLERRYRSESRANDLRRPPVRLAADPRRRTGGIGLRQRRHPDALPRAGAARPRLLDRRFVAGERVEWLGGG